MFLKVTVSTPEKIIFNKKASSVILPGEEGVFELLPLHKRIVSRLVTGAIHIDDTMIKIKRGIMMVDREIVTILVEK